VNASNVDHDLKVILFLCMFGKVEHCHIEAFFIFIDNFYIFLNKEKRNNSNQICDHYILFPPKVFINENELWVCDCFWKIQINYNISTNINPMKRIKLELRGNRIDEYIFLFKYFHRTSITRQKENMLGVDVSVRLFCYLPRI